MRNRLPIVYLVDSAGVNLPYQDGIFPGKYGAGRIFYYNSLMRRKLRIPQIAAVMGPCIAGGAYLPALSDVIIMVEGVSFMGLGGPNLVKGATGQVIEPGASGRRAPAHRGERRGALHGQGRRRLPGADPPAFPPIARAAATGAVCREFTAIRRARDPAELYAVLPADHRLPYDIEEVIFRIFDAGDYAEFQPEYAPEMLCANARLCRPSGGGDRQSPRIPQNRRPRRASAASSIPSPRARWRTSSETSERLGHPLIYLQDVSGFMVGPEAERDGIIRAGAEMVESMSCATVPQASC